MIAFSTAAVELACTALANRAAAVAAEVDEVLQSRAAADDGNDGSDGNDEPSFVQALRNAITAVCERLQALKQTLPSLPGVSPEMQAALSSQLAVFEEALASMEKPLQRVAAAGPDVAVDASAVVAYKQCFSALHSVLGIFQTALHEPALQDQDRILNNANAILAKADQARSIVLRHRDLISDEKPFDASRAGPSTSSPAPPNANVDPPPPYVDPIDASPATVSPVSPAAVQPVVSPVAVSPVGVNVVAVDPVAVNRVAVNPVAVNPVHDPTPEPAHDHVYVDPATVDPAVVNSAEPPAKGFFSALSESWSAFTRSKPDPLVAALCNAAQRADVHRMQGLLAHGANVNGKNEDGKTALVCAIEAQSLDTVRFLVSTGGASLSKNGRGGRPPLFVAARTGNCELARLLLDCGANVHATHVSGRPFFVDVCASADLPMMRLFLDRGADPNTHDLTGRSVFIEALRQNRLAAAHLLLERGADAVNARDISGRAALVMAGRVADGTDGGAAALDLVAAMLEHGADAVNARDISGQSLLSIAVQLRRPRLARLLLEHGADPNGRELGGRPVLVSAIRTGEAALVRPFMEHGASIEPVDSATRMRLMELMAEKPHGDGSSAQYSAPDSAQRTVIAEAPSSSAVAAELASPVPGPSRPIPGAPPAYENFGRTAPPEKGAGSLAQ